MPSEKKCSKCGKVFGCSNDADGCWCQQYTLSLDVLKHLKENFDNCLCPECLRGYTIDAANNTAN